MSRMADRLLIHPMHFSAAFQEPEDRRLGRDATQSFKNYLHESLPKATVIAADNVAEYFYAGTDQEIWNTRKDFPTLAPPFPLFFIEWRRPTKISSSVHGVISSDHMPYSTGILFNCFTGSDLENLTGGEASFQRTMARRFSELWPDVDIGAIACQCSESDDVIRHPACQAIVEAGKTDLLIDHWNYQRPGFLGRVGWQMIATAVVEPTKGVLVGPVAVWDFLLDQQGVPLGQEATWCFAGPRCKASRSSLVDSVDPLRFPALMALTFLNCKNVRVVASNTPEKLAKSFHKKHGKALCRYHWLDIEPMKKVLETEGGATTTGLKRALHICRGHFVDYSQGKGLFGKYHGRYWVPMHARGSVTEGVVSKDYQVKAPKAA